MWGGRVLALHDGEDGQLYSVNDTAESDGVAMLTCAQVCVTGVQGKTEAVSPHSSHPPNTCILHSLHDAVPTHLLFQLLAWPNSI